MVVVKRVEFKISSVGWTGLCENLVCLLIMSEVENDNNHSTTQLNICPFWITKRKTWAFSSLHMTAELHPTSFGMGPTAGLVDPCTVLHHYPSLPLFQTRACTAEKYHSNPQSLRKYERFGASRTYSFIVRIEFLSNLHVTHSPSQYNHSLSRIEHSLPSLNIDFPTSTVLLGSSSSPLLTLPPLEPSSQRASIEMYVENRRGSAYAGAGIYPQTMLQITASTAIMRSTLIMIPYTDPVTTSLTFLPLKIAQTIAQDVLVTADRLAIAISCCSKDRSDLCVAKK